MASLCTCQSHRTKQPRLVVETMGPSTAKITMFPRFKLMSRAARINMRSNGRRAGGFQIAEFGVALYTLVVLVSLPLLDLCVIPLRMALAQEMVTESTRRLARSETASMAFKGFSESIPSELAHLVGVEYTDSTVDITAVSLRNGDQSQAVLPLLLSKEWLPNGTRAPCAYSLHVTVKARTYPLVPIPLFGIKLPGFSTPVDSIISSSAPWENLGRDVVSKQFCVAQ
jgi:hypothetical protein